MEENEVMLQDAFIRSLMACRPTVPAGWLLKITAESMGLRQVVDYWESRNAGCTDWNQTERHGLDEA